MDLIRELEREESRFSWVALVVGCQRRTEYISRDDGANRQRLAKLNSLLAQDGEALGMIGIVLENGALSLALRPLEEFASEEWVSRYLKWQVVALTEDLKMPVKGEIPWPFLTPEKKQPLPTAESLDEFEVRRREFFGL